MRGTLSQANPTEQLDPDIAGLMEKEVDLKPLAALPAFKKLVAAAEEPNPNPVNP